MNTENAMLLKFAILRFNLSKIVFIHYSRVSIHRIIQSQCDPAICVFLSFLRCNDELWGGEARAVPHKRKVILWFYNSNRKFLIK